MFTSWNTGTFAVAVKLNNPAVFRCAPLANAQMRELAYVLWRAGDEQPADRRNGKFTSNYLITGLPEGARYVINRALAEPAIAAVIRVAIASEAELGFFRITVQKMLNSSDIDKEQYAVVPLGTCYQTPEYKSAAGVMRSNLRENVFVISTPDSNEGNAAWWAIRKLLMVDRRGDVATMQTRLLDSFNCLISLTYRH